MNNNPKHQSNAIQINENIKLREFIVIDEKGNNLGMLSRDQALELARNSNLDLVLISSKNNVGITKILDYSKFRYELKRKEKSNKKSQSNVKNKEIKVKPLISDHDLKVKANNAIRWLDDGDRVIFVIVSMGRMASKSEYIDIVYDKFIKMIGEAGKVQQEKKKINAYRYETIIVSNKKK